MRAFADEAQSVGRTKAVTREQRDEAGRSTSFAGYVLRCSRIFVAALLFAACSAPSPRPDDYDLRTSWWCGARGALTPREHYPPGWYGGVYYAKEYVAPNCHPAEHAACHCDQPATRTAPVCIQRCVAGP